MKLAYVTSDQTGCVNTLLRDFATALAARGVRLAGTTQIDTPRPKTHHCDMDVQVLPEGTVIRISQDLGPNASGCRLNPDALESAVAMSLERLDGAQLLIVNKFGKHEAEGRGFREVIGEAVARDIPVLVGTNGLNAPAFEEFSAGTAQALGADLDTLLAWFEPQAVAA